MGKPVNRPSLDDPSIKSYLPEVLRGIKTTSKHFFRNLFTGKGYATKQYPEERFPYAPRYRGAHRLMKREDGRVRCVACYMCVTACPADCIRIVAAESDDPAIEKYPAVFEIDHLKCIFCGFCEEVCPCDAIRLDTGEHRAPGYTREELITRKEQLLAKGGQSLAPQGGIYR